MPKKLFICGILLPLLTAGCVTLSAPEATSNVPLATTAGSCTEAGCA
ncbi:hypothetical protein IV417_10000 [Alphaproteobacteria bacterium KMM 3653]|uniref:Lipoprotein n=1 Tax=Harenicola maris TaxID=2841044 RepID=A0AAP2CR67_9RHOB|nr:hypothetical protein [Harenicola maris]